MSHTFFTYRFFFEIPLVNSSDKFWLKLWLCSVSCKLLLNTGHFTTEHCRPFLLKQQILVRQIANWHSCIFGAAQTLVMHEVKHMCIFAVVTTPTQVFSKTTKCNLLGCQAVTYTSIEICIHASLVALLRLWVDISKAVAILSLPNPNHNPNTNPNIQNIEPSEYQAVTPYSLLQQNYCNFSLSLIHI